MTIVTPTAADLMTLLASQVTLTLMRSLTDGEWATAQQLAEATGYSEFVVAAELAAMRAGGIVETLGELFRLDVAKVQDGFALVTADLIGA